MYLILKPLKKKRKKIKTKTETATVSSTHHQSLASSLLDNLNHQRADNRSKKNYNPAACGTKTTFTERQTR